MKEIPCYSTQYWMLCRVVKLGGAYLLSLMLVSCGPVKHITNTTSKNIEVKESVTYVPYMVNLSIPEIKESVRVKDTTSHLENDYAYSDAVLHKDGTLEHSLATKAQKLPQSIDVPIKQRDSIVYVDKLVETHVEVPIEKELTWWQRIRMKGFYVLLVLVLWAYRKYIKFLF